MGVAEDRLSAKGIGMNCERFAAVVQDIAAVADSPDTHSLDRVAAPGSKRACCLGRHMDQAGGWCIAGNPGVGKRTESRVEGQSPRRALGVKCSCTALVRPRSPLQDSRTAGRPILAAWQGCTDRLKARMVLQANAAERAWTSTTVSPVSSPALVDWAAKAVGACAQCPGLTRWPG